jgi:hypothetical protein
VKSAPDGNVAHRAGSVYTAFALLPEDSGRQEIVYRTLRFKHYAHDSARDF